MSENEHTPGRMVVSCGGIYEAEAKDADGFPCNGIALMARERVPDDPPYHVGPFRIPPTESDANAHRFVDCWNACEGVTDPTETARQRDELLEAASLKCNAILCDEQGFEGEWVAVPKADFDALRAAIKRAKEGS